MKKSTQKFLMFAVALGLVAVASPAMAQGLSSVNTFMSNVVAVLKGAGIVTVTAAIMWAGYKMVFKGAQLGEVAGPLVGALLIGSAATIAGFLIPA